MRRFPDAGGDEGRLGLIHFGGSAGAMGILGRDGADDHRGPVAIEGGSRLLTDVFTGEKFDMATGRRVERAETAF